MTTEEELIYWDETTTTPMITGGEGIDFTEAIATTTFYNRIDCSQYNSCGHNGHCRDKGDGEWRCVCKFWWSGTLCNELSTSGQQVITLGVMLAVLLIIFHGLALFRAIRRKRKESKTATESKPSTIQRKFPSIPIRDYHPSRRLFSWITAILTILVATGTLLAKWSILKPIHEEMVEKFNQNQTVFFIKPPFCRVIDLTGRFNLITFPVACLCVVLFAVITKRAAFYPNICCQGYFGIPIPFDFFAHVKRTLAAVIFAIFADELLDIALEILTNSDGESADYGIIVKYLLKIVRVFVIGFRRYPILAAVYINNCFSLTCASLYVWLDYGITIAYTGLCRSDFYPTNDNYKKMSTFKVKFFFFFYGTGSKMIFLQLLNDIPRYLCLAYISVKLPMLLIKRIRERHSIDRRITREQKDLLHSSLPNSVESQYVKRLLGVIGPPAPTNRLAQLTGHIYAWRDDFRFSTRVTCVYASLCLLLYFLTVQAIVLITPVLDGFEKTVQKLIDRFNNMMQEISNWYAFFNSEYDLNLQAVDENLPAVDENFQVNFPVPKLVRPFLFAVFISLFLIILQLFIMLAGIRRNLLQAFRGDASELPRRNPSNNVDYINGNFHFVGYLIGYVILGYVFLLVITIILAIVIDAYITYGSARFLESILKRVIPIILLIIFKLYLNKVLGRCVFLQDDRRLLFINNRRVFMLFLYFNCFLDSFLGLFVAIIRLVKGILGGLLYMCRLDYAPLGRKLETMDAGFSAYCGFIYIEMAHRHPVLLCFVSHLLRDHLYPSNKRRLSKAKRKWLLAVFLLNNPLLIYRRKGFLSRVKTNEISMMLMGGMNADELYFEQPPILVHRASIISDRALHDLWERNRF